MISIRDSLADLEKAHRIRAEAMDCYVGAIRNMAQYAVDFEEQLTNPYRDFLNSLADEVAGAEIPVLQQSRATLRGLLRDFRDKASQYLNNIRQELSNATSALQELMDTLSQSEGDHDSRLRTAIGKLREAGRITTDERCRETMRTCTDQIEQSLEDLRKQHQLTIAQFHMELRVLHQRIDTLENAAAVDNMSKLLQRAETEQVIARAETGSLLLIQVSGIRRASTNFEASVVDELTAAFTRRLRNTLPPQSAVGRWSQEGFVAILPTLKPEAVTLAKWLAEHLSGAYSCLQGGKCVRPALQLSVGVVELCGEHPHRVLAKVTEFLHGEQPATSEKADPHLSPTR